MEFSVKTIIKASPEVVYNAWLDSEQHTLMTGGEATVSDIEGNPFSAWDGYISGVNVKLEPYYRIQQLWRTTEFEDNELSSNLEILLKEIESGTEMTINHGNLPIDGMKYKAGWVEHYFEPMQRYFDTIK